jgi:hypothetical protein
MKQRIPTLDDYKSLNEGKPASGKASWKSENLNDEFYNLYASADIFANNLSHFMDDMNAGKTQDAVYALKVAYEEYSELEKRMKSQKEKIKKQLQDFNVNIK